jgi:uncharacterized protein
VTFPLTTEAPRGRRLDLPGVLVAAAAAVISYGVAITLLLVVPTDGAVAGVAQYLVSGLAPLVAVAIVYAVRVRGLDALGFRRIAPRWVLISIACGLGVIVLNIAVAAIVVTLTGPPGDVQADYRSAATAGPVFLVLTLLVGAVLTPIGEEALFRGVVANWLLRFGAPLAVPVSAAVFALVHGINYILPIAFVVGVVAALLFRATKSIWPGVIVHGVNNAYSVIAPVIFAGAMA